MSEVGAQLYHQGLEPGEKMYGGCPHCKPWDQVDPVLERMAKAKPIVQTGYAAVMGTQYGVYSPVEPEKT